MRKYCIIERAPFLDFNDQESAHAMITPKQASQSLNVPASTLRRWSKEFSDHLSLHKPGSHREYTTSDMSTLRKIRDHLDQGLRYEDIHNQLDIIEEAPDKSTALLLIEDYTQALEDAQAIVQALKSKMDNQDQRIKALEDYLSMPFHKRIFTKPPAREDRD